MAMAEIFGTVAAGFEGVREAFQRNYHRGDDYEELGSSLCVYHRGERVVDIWAGHKDREKTTPWTQDTTVALYSTTKGITGICMAVLVDRGLVSYSDLVSKHWPEFGQGGKQSTTVAHIMSHQSGNPGLRETIELDDLMNWELICGHLAAQEPYWTPGENTSYHGWTVGYLAGEIIGRVSGKSIGQFLREEIAEPLGADVYIGFPEDREHTVATLYKPKQQHELPPLSSLPDFLAAAVGNPVLDPESPNRREWRASEQPALCGMASAQGIARLFHPLAEGGTVGDFTLMSPQTIDKMTEVQSSRPDAMLGMPVDWANGMCINTLDLKLYGPNKKAFGHSGWGGSFGCADRDNRVAIGFVCNQMGPDTVGDKRTVPLLDAIYRSIDG